MNSCGGATGCRTDVQRDLDSLFSVRFLQQRRKEDGRKREKENMVQQNRMSLARLAEQISEVEFDNCAM